MDLDHLEAFLAVVQTKNFTKAAEQLNIVQSSVTARIKSLEENVGKRLFERGTRYVKLTPAGEVLLPYAEKTIEVILEGSLAVKNHGIFEERLSIGGLNSIWSSSVYKVILDFKRENPNIALHLATGHSNEVNQKIQEGIFDAGFVYLPPQGKGFEIMPISEETISLVASSSLALQNRVVSKRELLSLPYIHYNWGSPFSEWFEEEIDNHGMVALRVDHIELAMKMLINLKGIGFILDEIAKEYVYEGQLVKINLTDIESPLPKRKIYFVYLRKNKKKSSLNNLIKLFSHI